MRHTDLRPSFELAPCPDAVHTYPEPSLHWPPAHHKGLRARSTAQVARVSRIDPEQQTSLATRTHRHMAIDEEGQSAEHA